MHSAILADGSRYPPKASYSWCLLAYHSPKQCTRDQRINQTLSSQWYSGFTLPGELRMCYCLTKHTILLVAQLKLPKCSTSNLQKFNWHSTVSMFLSHCLYDTRFGTVLVSVSLDFVLKCKTQRSNLEEPRACHVPSLVTP